MNTSTLHHLKIALMTQEEHIRKSFASLANSARLNISAVDYHHLLSENYDLLIVDVCRGHTLPDIIFTKWKMPRIMITATEPCVTEHLRQFQALLSLQDISQGLPGAIKFALTHWEHEQTLNKRINDFEYQVGCRRFLVMAEIMVMRWFNCTEKDAWAMLRTVAMDTQSKVEEVCIDLLSTPEEWEKIITRKFFDGKKSLIKDNVKIKE